MDSLISAYNIYGDEYANSLDESNIKHDTLGFIFKPLWKLAARLFLVKFFFKVNYFTTNALTSLYHFPDGMYNRSPAIDWMQYKLVSAPNNLPILDEKNYTGYIMSGILAENYKHGKLSNILQEYHKQRSVGEKTEIEEVLTPIESLKPSQLKNKEIIEKDGKKYISEKKEKKTL